MLFRKLIYASLMLSLMTANVSFAAGIAETYYVPITEKQVFDTLTELDPSDDPTQEIRSIISVAVSLEGTIIYYDHWEDGYEVDILNPTQPSTLVFGDEEVDNGTICSIANVGCNPANDAEDFISDSEVLVLDNIVDTTVDPTTLNPFQFNARDKFASTQPLAVTRVSYAEEPGTVLAGAVEVIRLGNWGKKFVAPIGDNIAADGMFDLTVASLMASEDNTIIKITPDPSDLTDFFFLPPINQGVSLLTPLSGPLSPFKLGAILEADKPIQVHLMAGDPTAVYESRWITALPFEEWGNEYFSPVSTRLSATEDPSDVFVFNPHDSNLEVTCQAEADCTDTSEPPVIMNSATILPGSFVRFRIPEGSGARISSGDAGNEFSATGTVDSNPDLFIGGWDAIAPEEPQRGDDLDFFRDSDNNNMDFDWGFALPLGSVLSGQVLAGYAPATSDCTLTSPISCNTPKGLGSPLWVMSADGNTEVFIDYNGDSGNDIPNYDTSIVLTGFQNAKIFDPDGDNTGTVLFTTDGARIAVAWGQDPSSSDRLNPYFDAGTTIPPLPHFSMAKEVDKLLVSPGDVLTYTVNATNTSRSPIDNLTMVDQLPADVTYNEDTTFQDAAAVNQPDSGIFPLLDPGIELGELGPGETTSVTFEVTVDLDILPNVDPDNDCPDPQTAVINNAIVSDNFVSFDDDALTCVEFDPEIDIEKLTNGVDADNPDAGDAPQIKAGDTVTWTYRVTNTGQLPLINIVVVDDIIGPITTCPKSALAVGESMDCIVNGTAENVSTIDNSVPGTCGEITETPLYENKGTATGFTAEGEEVNDDDLSHYCNPLVPSITIEKSTNGVDADDPDAGDAPQIAIGDTVNWAYLVTNTGDLTLNPVVVVDDQGVAVSCPETALDPGDFMTCTASGPAVDVSDTTFTTVPGTCGEIPNTPLYANKGTATGTSALGDVEATDPSHYCNDIPEGGEGCTPGYWKQSQHFGSWTSPYSPVPVETLFSEVFEDAFPGKTLLEVLKQGGGGLTALGRHSVAALLNAASGGVAYDLTTDQVINGFNAIYPDGSKQDYNGLKDVYADFNEQGCPLNRAEWSEPE